MQYLDFFGYGKKSIMKSFLKLDSFDSVLEDANKELPLSKAVQNNPRLFTTRVLHDDKKSTSLAEARANKWKSMKMKKFKKKSHLTMHVLSTLIVIYLCYLNLNYMRKDAILYHPQNFMDWNYMEINVIPIVTVR